VTHPEFVAFGSYQHLKLGRTPKRHDPRTLMLAKYIDTATVLPQIPATFDLTPPVPDYEMDGNSEFGNCTCAAAAHLIEAWTASGGALRRPALADVMTMYWETGQPPAATGTAGGATDDGRNELDVLNYWRNPGLGSDRIGAYTSIVPTDHDLLRTGLFIFGGVYTGLSLPLTAQGQREWDVVGDGKTGASAPGSWGGHAVPALPVWDGETLTVVTWGATLKMTLAFWDAYADECYAIVSPDALGSGGVTAQGLNLDALTADLSAIV
jgi:hypothetical protein